MVRVALTNAHRLPTKDPLDVPPFRTYGLSLPLPSSSADGFFGENRIFR
jgi:hypothetical protein